MKLLLQKSNQDHSDFQAYYKLLKFSPDEIKDYLSNQISKIQKS